ncbi:MAG: hypothetical protein OXU75_11940 [Deltaproteobacteria bacterium]|nr:hypothetical protein [Deltaproteobacteria bacterium]
MRQINELKPWTVVHELREEKILSEDLLMRVNKIIVEEVDREYYVWLDDKLLVLNPQQAQQLADEIHEAVRARWRPTLRMSEPQRQEDS